MEATTFILNPAAGKGKAERVWHQTERMLISRGERYVLRRTSARGEATLIAREATTRRVVAVGGDGTVQEVSNGLVGTEKVLGIVPAGSGNDLIKSLRIPQGTEEAVDIILSGHERRIDVGTVRCSREHRQIQPHSSGDERIFVNGVGVGFDAAVAARTQEIPWLTGTALYLAAVFQTLGKYNAPTFQVEMDADRFESRNLLFAIGNGRCAGGGFYLTPEAIVDDGLLDVCAIASATVPRILTLMPKAMSGKHGEANEVKFYRTRTLHLQSATEFFVHADGEVVGRSVRSVEVSVLPSALRVVAPVVS